MDCGHVSMNLIVLDDSRLLCIFPRLPSPMLTSAVCHLTSARMLSLLCYMLFMAILKSCCAIHSYMYYSINPLTVKCWCLCKTCTHLTIRYPTQLTRCACIGASFYSALKWLPELVTPRYKCVVHVWLCTNKCSYQLYNKQLCTQVSA